MMIPDCLKRLVTATEDLRNKLAVCTCELQFQIFNFYLKSHLFIFLKDVDDLGDIPEVQEANKQLQEAENMLNE